MDGLFGFPIGTFVVAINDPERPSENPIEVKAGDLVHPFPPSFLQRMRFSFLRDRRWQVPVGFYPATTLAA